MAKTLRELANEMPTASTSTGPTTTDAALHQARANELFALANSLPLAPPLSTSAAVQAWPGKTGNAAPSHEAIQRALTLLGRGNLLQTMDNMSRTHATTITNIVDFLVKG